MAAVGLVTVSLRRSMIMQQKYEPPYLSKACKSRTGEGALMRIHNLIVFIGSRFFWDTA